MILKYNYWQFQSILPKEVCENIIKFAKEKKQKKGKVGMNNKLKPNLVKRDSNVVWLKEDWIYKTVLPYLDSLLNLQFIKKDNIIIGILMPIPNLIKNQKIKI